MKKHFSFFNFFNLIFLSIVSITTLVPFLLVLGSSFSDEISISKYGFSVIPRKFSLAAYRSIFANGSTILNAYKVTLIITIVGTIVAVAITSMLAYALSRKQLKYKNILNLFVYIPMVFSGGIVPFYIVIHKLGFVDKIGGLIIPMVFNPFNFFLLLNFFRGLPDEIVESAKIDGAGEFRILLSIVMKIALPGIATISLFYSLAFWNDWTLALYLINKTELYPLQFLLRAIMQRATIIAGSNAHITGDIPAESVKMATVIVTIGPILLVYPFVQRYFVKGLTIGSVKG